MLLGHHPARPLWAAGCRALDTVPCHPLGWQQGSQHRTSFQPEEAQGFLLSPRKDFREPAACSSLAHRVGLQERGTSTGAATQMQLHSAAALICAGAHPCPSSRHAKPLPCLAPWHLPGGNRIASTPQRCRGTGADVRPEPHATSQQSTRRPQESGFTREPSPPGVPGRGSSLLFYSCSSRCPDIYRFFICTHNNIHRYIYICIYLYRYSHTDTRRLGALF